MEIEKLFQSLRLKCLNNIFAQIFIDILYNEYEYNRYGLVHLGIFRSIINATNNTYFKSSKEQIQSTYNSMDKTMMDLISVSGNSFINLIDNHKLKFPCFQINVDDRKMVTIYSLNESFEFFKNVCLSNYCHSIECQKAKDQAANKLKKTKWREDPYNKIKDNFNGYFDRQANILKNKGIAENEIKEFKTFRKKIKIDVKMEVDAYGDTSIPLPSEIEKYIDEQKRIVIQKRNEILLRHGIILTRGRPKKE